MKLKKAQFVAGLVAAFTLLITQAAFASNVLSVDGTTSPPADVNVTGVNSGALSMLTDVGLPISCSTSSVTGTARRGGSVTINSQIGKITNVVLGTAGAPCTMTTLNYPIQFSKTPAGTKTPAAPASWPIVVTATPAKGAATVPIRIDNIDVKMQSTSKTGTPATYVCDLRVRGTVTGTFNQTTQQIVINPPAGTYPLNAIDAYDGSGTNTASPLSPPRTCAGWIYTGDSMRLTGTFTLSTPGVGGIHW